jgi:hypothetical protein
MADVNFLMLAARAGSTEAGRVRFAQLVIDLVGLKHPTVRDIRANPGDWGIDGFVGSLDDGDAVLVWQSKFFIGGVGKTQQQEIRESFESCISAAAKEGYRVSTWTLCVPESMDGPTAKWWDKWKKGKEADHDLVIELWEPAQFRQICRAPEAHAISEEYFGAGGTAAARELEAVPDPAHFDGMLFIDQLLAASIDPEPAKYEFFNAELLRREALDKTGGHAQKFLDGFQEELFSMWRHRWEAQRELEETSRLLPGLHSAVMSAIEQLHAAPASASDAVPMRLAHRKGAMHQVVETGRAGWVRDFESIVREHSE